MKIKKKTAANEQFHASGGAVSSDTEQVTSSFALVRAVAMPPPAAKPQTRCLQAEDTLQSFSADFDFVKLDNL